MSDYSFVCILLQLQGDDNRCDLVRSWGFGLSNAVDEMILCYLYGLRGHCSIRLYTLIIVLKSSNVKMFLD